MPAVFKRDGNSVLGPLGIPEELDVEDASLRDVFGAAFRQENTLASLYVADRSVPLGVQDEEFDAYEHIGGTPYEEFADAFVHADSQGDVEKVMAQIDRELQDRDTIASAGLLGFAASFAAGAFDPILLLPVGGVAGTTFKGGAGILKTASSVGRAGFIGASATEAALHASQETRTFGESASVITAATFLSGIVGGSLGAIPKSLRKRAIREIDQTLGEGSDVKPGRRVGVVAGGADPDAIIIPKSVLDADTTGPGPGGTTQTEELLKGAFGAENIVGGLNPMMRSARSPFLATRKLVQELADTSLYYEKNALGVATPISVESDIMAHQAPLARALSTLNEQFVKYRTGKATTGLQTQRELAEIAVRDFRRTDRAFETLDNLTFSQFRRLAGKTARRGDSFRAVPEIDAAAKSFRAEVFDPLKDRAIELGLLPEDVAVETADSYLSRVWRRDEIRKNRNVLHTRTVNWLRERHPELSEKQFSEVSDDIIDRLLGLEPGRTQYDAFLSGPLKGRTFLIPDEMIEDFLESDISIVGKYYTSSMAPDVELTTRFGSVDMKKQIDEIRAEFRERVKEASDTKDIDRLSKAVEDDIRDIEAMRDRLRGTFKAPDDPDGLPVRAGRFIRNVNFFTVLGGVAVSSLPDIANNVLYNGVNRFMGDGVQALIRNPKVFRLAAEESKLAGTSAEIVLNRRARSLAEIGDEFGRYSKLEQAGRSIADTFPLVSGLSFWNEGGKLFASIPTMARILDASAASKLGRISPGDVEKLARSGIDPAMAGKIADQFEAHGEIVDGIRMANTEAWDDLSARRAFRAAVRKDVDTIILTPGVGDRPLWMSTEMGALIGQFKTFAMTATHRIALAQLQQRDAASLHGILFATFIGMLVFAQKTLQAGKDPFEANALTWVKEGIDRSGITGIAMDVNNILEKATRGEFGLSAAIGGPTASRYASRNVLDALAGPTAGRILTTAKVTGALATGEFNRSDAASVRRMLPYQNLFYLDKLFDGAEAGLRAALVSTPSRGK